MPNKEETEKDANKTKRGYVPMKILLSLNEACDLLNEGIVSGKYKTKGHMAAYTSKQNIGAITGGNISAETEWESNPWYISTFKLKEYALHGIVPYSCGESVTEMRFEYQDIIKLRADIKKLRLQCEKTQKQYPKRRQCFFLMMAAGTISLLGPFVLILVSILWAASSEKISGNSTLSAAKAVIQNAVNVANAIVMRIRGAFRISHPSFSNLSRFVNASKAVHFVVRQQQYFAKRFPLIAHHNKPVL